MSSSLLETSRVDINVDNPLVDYLPQGEAPRLASHRIETPPEMREGRTWPLHAHHTHELLWGIEGVVILRTETAIYAVPGGASIWVPAGIAHEVHAGPGSALLCSWFADEGERPGLEHVAVLVTPTLLDQVLDHLMVRDLSAPERANAEAFALDLLEPTPRLVVDVPLPHTPWLRVITDALLERPADDRTVEEWAALCRVSVRTLMRHFQAETGLSFSGWRTEVRMRFAIQRLTLGDSVATVARGTGFRTAAAFGAAFRKHTGVTPGTFLRVGVLSAAEEAEASSLERGTENPSR
ncbi:helix-turn-helix domain-containing protein [Mycetocola tolaasinivorans]|nr:AraC family transcriptional regulator [Mycetocola tolaasinivorans]